MKIAPRVLFIKRDTLTLVQGTVVNISSVLVFQLITRSSLNPCVSPETRSALATEKNPSHEFSNIVDKGKTNRGSCLKQKSCVLWFVGS